MLTQEQVDELAAMGVHRYNHNLETARSYFPSVVTTHTWEERWDTCRLVREAGMELCCGGIVGMGETARAARRVRRAAGRARAGRGAAELPQPAAGHAVRRPAGRWRPRDALRAIAAFRLAMPAHDPALRRRPRDHPRRPGTREGLLGGINAVIVGNYLTTLGRPRRQDLAMLEELRMPIKALNADL